MRLGMSDENRILELEKQNNQLSRMMEYLRMENNNKDVRIIKLQAEVEELRRRYAILERSKHEYDDLLDAKDNEIAALKSQSKGPFPWMNPD